MSGPQGTSDALASARALSDAGDHARALEAVARLLAAEPDRADAHTARGWALENLGPDRLAEARDAYVEALRLDPGQLWAKEGLSNVLRRLGRPAEADVLAAEVVVAATKDDAETLELKGWCEYRLGRLDDAETSFRRALEHEADALSVRFDLGLVLLRAGRGAEGLAAYETGLVAARRDEVTGVVAVALEDLDEAMTERACLRTEPWAVAARAILAGFTGASSGSPALPMGEP